MQTLRTLFHGWKALFLKHPYWLPISLWLILVIVVSVRATLSPTKGTVYPTFALAGHTFAKGEPVYGNYEAHFRYSPVWAAFFSVFNLIPDQIASIVWRLLNLVILTWGAYRFQKCFFPEWSDLACSIWWVGLFPFCIGSFNNAQANMLLLGLLMGSVATFTARQWTLCGILLAIAISLKVYPFAMALLLLLIRPKELLPPLVVSLLLIAGIPFAFHDSAYVIDLYRDWIHSSLGDTKIEMDLKNSNRDIWLLIKAYSLPISHRAYQVIQLAAAACLAFWTWRNRSTLLKTPPSRTKYVWLFCLTITWMLVFGPASESSTYALFAPLAAIGVVMAIFTQQTRATTLLICLGVIVGLLSHFSSAFSFGRELHHYGIHPIGALLMLVAVLRIRFDAPWRNTLPSLTGTSPTVPI
ncbi:MAG: DUF2029 domain-containing protein [Planctomycetia bacterium]|nr:DUF2029 domain-containing protein [Planctomycetia bacterium]